VTAPKRVASHSFEHEGILTEVGAQGLLAEAFFYLETPAPMAASVDIFLA
jgi:hypothetical protein